jgi:hypothetical protein
VVTAILVVGTTGRPRGGEYLGRTLRELELEGALDWPAQRVVLADGPLVVAQDLALVDPRWTTLRLAGPSGTRRMLWRALALAEATGAERLVFVEDDVRPCTRAVETAVRMRVPDGVAFLSLHDIYAARPRADSGMPGASLVEVPLVGAPGVRHDFCGTQAVVIPGRTARFLAPLAQVALDWSSPRTTPDGQAGSGSMVVNCGDVVMAEMLHALSPWRTYALASPSLFLHVGDESVAWPQHSGPGRARSALWEGSHYDSRALLRAPLVPWQSTYGQLALGQGAPS